MRSLKAALVLPLALVATPLAAADRKCELSAWGSYVSITKTTAVDDAFGVGIDFDRGAGFGVATASRVAGPIAVEVGASFLRSRGAITVQGQHAVDLGTLDMVPIHVAVQLHPLSGTFDPYVGVGGAYVIFQNFHSRDLDSAGIGVVSIDNKVALRVSAGLAFFASERFGFAADVTYLPLRPTSTGVASGQELELKLDPIVASVGIKLKF